MCITYIYIYIHTYIYIYIYICVYTYRHIYLSASPCGHRAPAPAVRHSSYKHLEASWSIWGHHGGVCWAQKSVLEGLLGASGGYLGPSWPQEHLKTPRGEEMGLQGSPWYPLLRGQVGPRWCQVGTMLAPRATKRPFKMHAKF